MHDNAIIGLERKHNFFRAFPLYLLSGSPNFEYR
jgi:hypothetical protein